MSEERRKANANGQKPRAVIVTCSDSRVVPEAVFSCGIGELFVIRTAGNVIGVSELASVEYVVDHLGTDTVVVLGHTACGAVRAAAVLSVVCLAADPALLGSGTEKHPYIISNYQDWNIFDDYVNANGVTSDKLL
ncbi:MAG: hypothetical protein IJU57_03240 [Clostridia bacterium]|nr:hypothetical protein [Clostridia bacterium]